MILFSRQSGDCRRKSRAMSVLVPGKKSDVDEQGRLLVGAGGTYHKLICFTTF